MQVKIRLFATLRQLAGWTQLTLDLPEDATVAAALAEVDRQYPQLTLATRTIYVAVNQEYARGTQVLGPGDEVAIFPPVSGGAPEPWVFVGRDSFPPHSGDAPEPWAFVGRDSFPPHLGDAPRATKGTNHETL